MARLFPHALAKGRPGQGRGQASGNDQLQDCCRVVVSYLSQYVVKVPLRVSEETEPLMLPPSMQNRILSMMRASDCNGASSVVAAAMAGCGAMTPLMISA